MADAASGRIKIDPVFFGESLDSGVLLEVSIARVLDIVMRPAG
jgi:hypothetical protein